MGDVAVAVVTGGGGGIGSAIAGRLASEGASVVLTYLQDETKAQAVADGLAAGDHLVVRAPVDDAEAQVDLANLVTEHYGMLDLLVNNAGITRPVPHDDLDDLDDQLIDDIFRVNWRGAYASVRALRPLLESGEGGTVINISSVAAVTGFGSNVAYCASKAAMDSMTRSLGRALAPSIRVVSVAPGWVMGEYAARMPPEVLEAQRAATPLGRVASVDDVANAVWAVATELTFTTGCVVPVDGGRPLGN